MTIQNFKKLRPSKRKKIRELKQEKIIFKELYKYLVEHEKHAKKIFDSMSHELRTPTVSIKAYTEMLLEGKFGDLTIQQKEKLERIKENIDVLVDVIFKLLEKKQRKIDL